MKKSKVLLIGAVILMFSISGCKKSDLPSQYSTDGVGYIAYTNIDAVCEDTELIQEGADLLSSLEENLLLSFVVDSSIELSDELGNYDHLIMTNPQWIERFGDPDKLVPVDYDSLSNEMQEFLKEQMPLLTADGTLLPDGVGLYKYDSGKLLAFPVNVTLGASEAIEAANPLIILVDEPAKILNVGSCTMPLTSSGNILFTDSNKLQYMFDASELKAYGSIRVLDGVK